MKKVMQLLILLIAPLAQAQFTGGGAMPSGPAHPGTTPVLTSGAARLEHVYNTAALNLVLSLKTSLDANEVTPQICAPNESDPAKAASDIIEAFRADTVLPADEKLFVTRTRGIHCLGYPNGGLNDLLDQTCKAVLANAPNYTITNEQLDNLKTKVASTLECMRLE